MASDDMFLFSVVRTTENRNKAITGGEWEEGGERGETANGAPYAGAPSPYVRQSGYQACTVLCQTGPVRLAPVAAATASSTARNLA